MHTNTLGVGLGYMNNKKDPKKDIDAEVEFTCPCGKTTNLDYIVKNERKVFIDFILESGLLEEKTKETEGVVHETALGLQNRKGHNTLARDMKEFMSNMDSV